jgi:hypothetical protein
MKSVLVSYVFHSKVLEAVPRSVLKVIDTHDVFERPPLPTHANDDFPRDLTQ